VRTTLTYRLHRTLSAGFEYNPRPNKFSPLLNWLLFSETNRRPALILGTSSDRIGTPSGQSFYATLSKSLKREVRLPVAPYVGVAYGTFEDRLRVIGGLNLAYTESLGTLLLFDGVHLHGLFHLSFRRHVASVLLVRGRDLGLSYSITF
jgi:hypothetical protein